MSRGERTRREFLKTTSAAVASVAVAGQLSGAPPRPADTSKILNYNPKMGYAGWARPG